MGRIGLWYGGIDSLPSPQAREAIQEAEALGYGSLWLAEAVGRDPFAHAGILLSATERIVVATGIANIYARDPMTMVAGQRTLAEAFPGRFLLGLGVSHAHLVAGVRKHDYSKPYSYMVDYLERMAKARFMAVQPTVEPGVLLAALGPKMLELSAHRRMVPTHISRRQSTPQLHAKRWVMMRYSRQNKWWCYQQIPMKLAALLGQV